jgi:hypothetical protein
MDLVPAISAAIARMEGFYTSGSIAQRNNNPGNLRSWGTRRIRFGYAYFDTAEGGWAALYRQVRRNIDRRLTLYEFFGGKVGVYAGYSPASDRNDPVTYARYVAGHAGVPADVPLDELEAGITTAETVEDTGTMGSGGGGPAGEDGAIELEPQLGLALGITAAVLAWSLWPR